MYLLYTENISKNNSGELAQRKIEPKQVQHHANVTNPTRCLVNLFKTYRDHCPPTNGRKTNAFYLTSIRKPKSSTWYSTTAAGHNTLAQTVKHLCKEAGIEGFKTNHSLRVSNATRLFQSGVDEQLIMSRTGHRSVAGVRTNKRVSEEQKRALSSVLNSTTSSSTCSSDDYLPVEKKAKLSLSVLSSDETATSKSEPMDTKTDFVNKISGIHFHGCSTITVTYISKYM